MLFLCVPHAFLDRRRVVAASVRKFGKTVKARMASQTENCSSGFSAEAGASCVDSLLRCASSFNDKQVEALRLRLLSYTVKEVKGFAKSFDVRLTGVNRKVEMVDRLIGMARIGALKRMATPGEEIEEDGASSKVQLSYITQEVKDTLALSQDI